jgi:hypothetical protein
MSYLLLFRCKNGYTNSLDITFYVHCLSRYSFASSIISYFQLPSTTSTYSSSSATSFTPFSANFLLLFLLILLRMFYSIMIPGQNLPSVSSSSSFFLKFLLSSFTFLFFVTFFPPHMVGCILLCLILLKPISFFTFHQAYNSKILPDARFALSVLCGSRKRQRLLFYTP